MAEACFGPKKCGIKVSLTDALRSDVALFAETQSRIIISVAPKNQDQILNLAKEVGVPAKVIGVVTSNEFCIELANEGKKIHLNSMELRKTWDEGFEKTIFDEVI
ncbi:MAG: phosphoribosylformylglycinamidine synthase II [uncultured bacterium]|nr:MAG: phosphoribosylformylglycinamidine synthase II [uncultured bacterium]